MLLADFHKLHSSLCHILAAVLFLIHPSIFFTSLTKIAYCPGPKTPGVIEV